GRGGRAKGLPQRLSADDRPRRPDDPGLCLGADHCPRRPGAETPLLVYVDTANGVRDWIDGLVGG
ncbi:MAG: hypothetical protein KJO42_04715, partial [Silicimonas sp.]|nr:hypothetical protein [Silicimonas sp.]